MAKDSYTNNPLLKMLEQMFEQEREKVAPLYPYDAKANTITLPGTVKAELVELIRAGKKVEAISKVTILTGAGLRLAKDYVDDLSDNLPI